MGQTDGRSTTRGSGRPHGADAGGLAPGELQRRRRALGLSQERLAPALGATSQDCGRWRHPVAGADGGQGAGRRPGRPREAAGRVRVPCPVNRRLLAALQLDSEAFRRLALGTTSDAELLAAVRAASPTLRAGTFRVSRRRAFLEINGRRLAALSGRILAWLHSRRRRWRWRYGAS